MLGVVGTGRLASRPVPSRLLGFARDRVRGLPGPFWVLWLGTLVNRLGYLVEPFLAYYLTSQRGMSVTTAGTVLAVSGIGGVLSQPVAGVAADRLGRRATLTLGMLASGSSLIVLGYVRGLAPIAVVAFVFGVAVNAYWPASQALVADLVSPAQRPRAYGLLFWAINIGFSAAMVLGGVLARSGFIWLFWADAVTCGICALLVWRGVPGPGPAPGAAGAGGTEARETSAGSAGAGDAGRETGNEGTLGTVLRDRLMIGYVAATLAYTFVYLQSLTTLPLAMRLRGLPPQDYGLALALNGIMIVALQPLAGGWLDRRDPVAVLAAGTAVVGLGFGLTSLATSTAAFAATIGVWTLGEIMTAGASSSIVASLAPPRLRGRYSGFAGAAWGAGYLLAPLGGTHLLVLGAPVLWLTCAGLCAAASAGLLALGPAVRRRARQEGPHQARDV